ncbi:MAG TPA: hypothetical protein VI076_10230 [Actinopolymorphaceae bacterium]
MRSRTSPTGAWLVDVFRLDGDGRFSVDFDYEKKPNLVAVTDDDYLEDLEKFPRAPDLVPAWHPRPWTFEEFRYSPPPPRGILARSLPVTHGHGPCEARSRGEEDGRDPADVDAVPANPA